MDRIDNQLFENETIGFDGFHFVDCTFRNCLIIITTLDFAFDRCSFFDTSFHVIPELPVFEEPDKLTSSTGPGSDTRRFWSDLYRTNGSLLELAPVRK